MTHPGSADGPPSAPLYGAPRSAPPTFAAPSLPAPTYGPPPPFFVPPVPGPGEPYNGAAHPSDLIRPLYGATFAQSIRRFFASYTRFTGRASRSEFWWSFLFCGLVRVVPFLLLGIVAIVFDELLPVGASDSGAARSLALLAGLVIIIVYLGLLLPQLAITARRLHDGNNSALLLLLILIPWVGTVIIGVFMLLGSRPEARRFDSDPMPAPSANWPTRSTR